MSYTKHIGIDPGKSGAAACVTISDGSIDDVDWLCFNHRDTSAKQILKMFQTNWTNPKSCVVEKVHSSPQMGVVSSFSFGKSAGAIEVLVDLAYPLTWTYCSPRYWQSRLNCLTKGNKNVTRLAVKKMLPSIAKQITHRNADAILIALYGAVQHESIDLELITKKQELF